VSGHRIKLLKFLTNFKIGGTERQVLNLAGALDRSRFDVHMACLGRSGDLLAQAGDCGRRLAEYRIRSLYGPTAMREQVRFALHLRRSGIQVVHSYGFYSNVFAAAPARLAGVPVVIASIRDMGDLLTPRQRRVQKWFCRAAHCIVANAEAIRRSLLAEGYPAERIAVVPNGIELPPPVSPRLRGRVRRELGLPDDARLGVVVSRLNPLKGIEYFLEAAARVIGEFPEFRFLVVGDGIDRGYRDSLERYAARLGLERRVLFTGFRMDVAAVLAGSEVSVLPSLSEGLSNTLLESMAAGVPVVATRVGGNAEAVAEGETGLLAPPRDPEALAAAIRTLLADRELAARFGQAGRRRVEMHFSVPRLVADTERLYRELLARAGASRSALEEAAVA
jgi:glycosyltransferase involved in cell wall biosynthesis